ncbi:MAG: hypothetical protein IT454_23200 [Planctomycetes bacterium]|nr:hypothetical protein [Planctomycetota bacterium]
MKIQTTLLVLLTLAACRAHRREAAPRKSAAPAPQAALAAPANTAPSPELDVADDWTALTALDVGTTGVWTVEVIDLLPQCGGPEAIALDDLGRCHVLIQYATRWTDFVACNDGTWLGGIAHGDLDPRVTGVELYVGAKSGHVYQVVPTPEGTMDQRLIADLRGQEVHTLLAVGDELLAFTTPGSLWRLKASASNVRFDARESEATLGRVRDAELLPDGRMALATRAGELLLRGPEEGARAEVVLRVASGLGRVARGANGVLYATTDDGVVWRCEPTSAGWQNERIYVGPPGLRGIAVGHFSEPAPREELAVFGYSARVELLARADDGAWSARTVFSDRDKGHWLAAGEFDERNSTDELLGSGYGGRVFVLARPAGYGRSGAAVSRP